MVNKGFPKFGLSQAGSYVATLKNYNLPEFILAIVAREAGSDLLTRGRLDDRLQSMNNDALILLHKIFVDCEDDEDGMYAQYRFYAYISSVYHKCEILINETIPGHDGKNHKLPVAVKSNGMYIAVAHNKPKGNPVSKKEIIRFYNLVCTVKDGDHGTMLRDAVYGSSVGFKLDALAEFAALSKLRANDSENRLDFKTANFENNIYSVTRR